MPDTALSVVGLVAFLLLAAVAVVIVPLLRAGIRTVYEYETGVVFTFGRFTGTKKAGLRFLVPGVQRMWKVDLRTVMGEVPRQEVLTRDNISLIVDAVVYYRVVSPETALVKVLDYHANTLSKAQAAVRDVLGSKNLDEILQDRSSLQAAIRDTVESVTQAWGIDVEDILLQQVELPVEMRRAMAVEAEAERERRARIITSRGQVQAAANTLKAAAVLSAQPGAFYMQTLQTMADMAGDPAQKIVIFMPTDVQAFEKYALSAALDMGGVRESLANAEESIRGVEKAFGEDADSKAG